MDELLAKLDFSDPTTAFWITVGFAGQLVFGSRFIVQWIASERAGQSVIPYAFWILSIIGNILLLSYAIYRKDPIFILSQGFNSIVYIRNLMLIAKQRRQEATT